VRSQISWTADIKGNVSRAVHRKARPYWAPAWEWAAPDFPDQLVVSDCLTAVASVSAGVLIPPLVLQRL